VLSADDACAIVRLDMVNEPVRDETLDGDAEDASRYDLMLGLQQVRFWLAAITVLLALILWRVW